MYESKTQGRNRIYFYEPEMQQRLSEKMEMESALSSALENNEFHLVYQPQFDTDGVHVRGYEALLRWESSTLGNVSPGVFIPFLEETGDIIDVGHWVLKTACEEFKPLLSSYETPPILSINMSVIQLFHPNYLSTVRQVLDETGYDPSLLEFEVTESVLISSMGAIYDIMNGLHDMGIRISLDDFGTGYSSLSYLQRYPFDVLKIDKSFVDEIDTQNNTSKIIPAIINLATCLGLEVIAEGVENVEQLAYLKSNSCSYIQGFYLGRPIPKKDIIT